MSKEKYEKLFKEIVEIELEDDVYYLFLNKKTISANNSRLDFNVFSIFYWIFFYVGIRCHTSATYKMNFKRYEREFYSNW